MRWFGYAVFDGKTVFHPVTVDVPSQLQGTKRGKLIRQIYHQVQFVQSLRCYVSDVNPIFNVSCQVPRLRLRNMYRPLPSSHSRDGEE